MLPQRWLASLTHLMKRILKPGPRPFIAFTVMFLLLLCLPAAIVITRDLWGEAGKLAACLFVIYGALCLVVRRARIIVSADSIAVQAAFGEQRRVFFRDITTSRAGVLAELEHPISLEVYCAGRQRPALQIGLKSFRRRDVAWLLSLPELKVEK